MTTADMTAIPVSPRYALNGRNGSMLSVFNDRITITAQASSPREFSFRDLIEIVSGKDTITWKYADGTTADFSFENTMLSTMRSSVIVRFCKRACQILKVREYTQEN